MRIGDPGILRVAVLLSGEGTSLENLFEKIESGDLPAQIAVVISSKENVGGLERARRRGIPAVAVPRKSHPNASAFNDAIHAELDRYDIDLVACLGFLSPFETRGKFDRRSINVHPALIPSFSGQGYYGQRVHEAVLAAGVKITGATVHFIDAEYDCGPIILQESLPVLDDDTPASLAERVQAAERRLVPEAIRLFASGRLAIDGRHVRILTSH
jgi:phosphoribosylglycinamide formyltransferase-1